METDMKRAIAIFGSISLILSFASVANVTAQEKSALAERMRSQVELSREPFEEKRKVLFSQYAAAVDRLANGFQDAGDLENVVKARKEAERARLNQVAGKDDFGGIAKLRDALQRELEVIGEAEKKVIAARRSEMLEQLYRQKKELTQAGKIDEALEVDSVLKELSKGDVIKAGASDMAKISILIGEDADRILGRVEPRKNLARSAETPEASSAYATRKPDFAINKDRADKISGIVRDEWAMTETTGWFEVKWREEVPVKAIILVNRLATSGGDTWIEGRILIDGEPAGPINEFGGKMVALIELSKETPVKSIRLEILKGRQAPGLASFEVYSEEDL